MTDLPLAPLPPPPAVRRFGWILLGTSISFCAVAYLWRGIDFALGVALGCAIVGFNYGWTRRVVLRAVRAGNLKAHVLAAYSLKFGLTLIVLFLAIVQFGVDALGIVIGVSALMVACVVLALSQFRAGR